MAADVLPAPPVLDACVLVAALVPSEAHHPAARRLLAQSPDRAFLVPPHFIVEVLAALACRGAPTDLIAGARALCESDRILALPLDEALVEAAVEMATTAKVHAGDALYAALAVMESAPLFTLDTDLAARLKVSYPDLVVFTDVA